MARSKHSPRKKHFSLSQHKSLLTVLGVLIVLSSGLFVTGSQLENRDTFCTSCHTTPETTYVDRSQQTTANDLASFHAGQGVKCIDCHSGTGITGRASAMSLGGLNAVTFLLKKDQQPHQLTHAINDQNCIKCHADTMQRQSFDNHFHVFLPKWQQLTRAAATCVDCHSSHSTNGDSTISFLSEQSTVQVCQSCHGFAGEGG